MAGAAGQGPRIAVVGGGFAGLESALLLRRRLQGRARITLVADETVFTFKPNGIYVPFGADPMEPALLLPDMLRRRGIELITGRVHTIDPERRRLRTFDEEIAYDYAVLATGARTRPREIPGLAERAITIGPPSEMLRLRYALRDLLVPAARMRATQVVFVVSPGNQWSGPVYELALMLDTWLRQRHVRRRIELHVVTAEERYAAALGPHMHDVIAAEFDRRHIHGYPGATTAEVSGSKVRFTGGAPIPFDLLVTAAPHAAATPYESLPSDARGFVRVEGGSRQVLGHPELFAVGDSSDYPVKQAFLALLQAHAGVEALAARVRGATPAFSFEPRSVYVMEQLDAATYTEGPLPMTGVESVPDAAAHGSYRVDTSPVWRVAKSAIARYVTWRFERGQPGHEGLPFMGLDAGRRLLSRALAR